MIVLFTIIFILLMFLAVYVNDKFYMEILTGVIAFISVIGIVACAIFTVGTIYNIAEGRYIDERIAVYQEENEKIEKDIRTIINQYQDHEEKVFNVSEVESAVTLIQMYPELKSDKLVSKQIKIFNENNKEIKALKSKKIDCKKSKFILYFGG